MTYLPADYTHDIAQLALRTGVVRGICVKYEDPVEFWGFRFRNPLGLGAGIDKDCILTKALIGTGIGFVTLGSVLSNPRSGNPRPRIIRYPRLKAMVNAMGLPSRGLMNFLNRLKKALPLYRQKGINVIVNIAGFSIDEFVLCIEKLRKEGVELFEINISCPMYKGSWVKDVLLLERLLRSIEWLNVWAFIKMPLGIDIESSRLITRLAQRLGFGLTIANTLPVKHDKLSIGHGGLSGLPIYPIVKRLVRLARKWGFENPVIALGGVFHGSQIVELRRLGADLVGVVTAFAFEGPFVFARIFRELRGFAKRH